MQITSRLRLFSPALLLATLAVTSFLSNSAKADCGDHVATSAISSANADSPFSNSARLSHSALPWHSAPKKPCHGPNCGQGKPYSPPLSSSVVPVSLHQEHGLPVCATDCIGSKCSNRQWSKNIPSPEMFEASRIFRPPRNPSL